MTGFVVGLPPPCARPPLRTVRIIIIIMIIIIITIIIILIHAPRARQVHPHDDDQAVADAGL